MKRIQGQQFDRHECMRCTWIGVRLNPSFSHRPCPRCGSRSIMSYRCRKSGLLRGKYFGSRLDGPLVVYNEEGECVNA